MFILLLSFRVSHDNDFCLDISCFLSKVLGETHDAASCVYSNVFLPAYNLMK